MDLILQFKGQYSPAVGAELEQMIATIQQWANGLKGLGVWVDVPFTKARFGTNSTGSITPVNHRPYVLQYMVVGNTMFLQAGLRVTVNNGTTTEIRVLIPDGYVAQPYQDTSDGDQAAAAAFFNGGGVAGAAGAFIDINNNCISVQRWDGIAAAGYPSPADVFIRFQIAIRINQKLV